MMSRPKVLMFIDWYLPGYRAGGPIRSCANMVEHLSSSVDFFIVTRDRDYQSDEPYSDIQLDEWITGRLGEYIMYLKEESLNSHLMKSLIEEKDYSHIYIHGLFSPIFSIKTHRFFRNRPEKIILAPRGMLRQGALSLKAWKKKTYLSLSKLLGWYNRTHFHATDEQEANDIRRWFGKDAQVHIAPNLAKIAEGDPKLRSKEKGELELVFIGRISPEKNLKLAIETIQALPIGGVTLDIYGAVYDQAYLRECEELVSKINNGNRVRFCGTRPPSEIQSVLESSHALFLPTKGENFGHVILESFMAARPVLISTETPWKDLESQGLGYDIDLDDDLAFQKALIRLLEMENNEYQQMCEASYNKYKLFSTDERIVAASKGLFLTREG